MRSLVFARFSVELSLASVGALIVRLGLTPQKPLERVYQRQAQAAEHWKCETFPAIVKKASSSGANILFRDKAGFFADAVHAKT